MRFRLSKNSVCAALALALGAATCYGQAEKDDAADSKAPAGANSADQWPSTGGILDQLFGPVESSGGDSSGSGGWTVGLAPTYYVPSKHTQEMMDMKRNWVFMDMNDLYPPGSLQELSSLPEYGPDGQEKKAASLLSKYYDSLERGGAAGGGGKDGGLAGGFSSSGTPVPGSDSFFKSIFSPGDSTPSDKAGAAFVDPAFATASARQNQEQQTRVDAFKHLLDPSLPSAPANPESTLYGLSDPFRPAQASGPFTAPAAAAQPNRSSLSGVPGMDPLRPRYLDDPTARALGLNPAPAQPAAQPSITLQQLLDPSMGRPKRAFQ